MMDPHGDEGRGSPAPGARAHEPCSSSAGVSDDMMRTVLGDAGDVARGRYGASEASSRDPKRAFAPS